MFCTLSDEPITDQKTVEIMKVFGRMSCQERKEATRSLGDRCDSKASAAPPSRTRNSDPFNQVRRSA